MERGEEEEDWSGEGVCLVLPYQGSLKRVGIHEHARTRVGDVASSSGKPLPLLSLSLYMSPSLYMSLYMCLYVSVYVPALKQASVHVPVCLCICARSQASPCICARTRQVSVYVPICLCICARSQASLVYLYMSAYCLFYLYVSPYCYLYMCRHTAINVWAYGVTS